MIRIAIDEKRTDASTLLVDGTLVAAHASRHRLLTPKKVDERLELLDKEIAKLEAAEVAAQDPQLDAVTDDDEVQTGAVAKPCPACQETEPNEQPAGIQDTSTDPTQTRDQGCSFMGRTKRGLER